MVANLGSHAVRHWGAKVSIRRAHGIGKRLSEVDTNEYLAEMANSLRLVVTDIAEFLGSQKFPEELKRFEAYFYA